LSGERGVGLKEDGVLKGCSRVESSSRLVVEVVTMMKCRGARGGELPLQQQLLRPTCVSKPILCLVI